MRPIVVPLAAAAVLAACAPKHIEQQPIVSMNDHISSSEPAVAAAAARGDSAAAANRGAADSILAVATANCAPELCAAIARGEATVGMSATQILAATRTTPSAWSSRRSGDATILVAASLATPPKDAAGELTLVQLAGDRTTMLTYRDAHGLRVVRAPIDATAEARARDAAAALIREGDALAEAGNYDAALDRYDRASVLGARDPDLEYKQARVLDRQMRPIEALMRYQRFLNQLDIDRINAQGEANAKLSAAIVDARQRIIVLEKQAR